MEFGQSRFLVWSPAGHASWPLASLVSAWLLGLAVASGFLVARVASSPTAAAKRTECMSVSPCTVPLLYAVVRMLQHPSPPRPAQGTRRGVDRKRARPLGFNVGAVRAHLFLPHPGSAGGCWRLAAGSLTAGHSRRARTRARARAREIVNERVHMHPSPLITADEGRPTPDSSHALVHFVAAAVCDGISESRSRIHGRGHVTSTAQRNGARASVCVGFAECRALRYGMSHF